MKDIQILKLSCSPEDDCSELLQYNSRLKSDVFYYNADISGENVEQFTQFVEQNKRNENCHLFFVTDGGDIDAAYRMARFFKKHYAALSLYIYGHCKSAGTLFALGANEIIMGARGEFGPLDVQVFDRDEFLQRSSGLSIHQSLNSIGKKSFELFEMIFLNLRQKSGGNITTQTASDIASKIAVGLYAPITQQIDSARLGELQRSLDIAIHYGIRLGASEDLVRHLTMNYPCHSFVIDYDEAKKLFQDVREPEKFELTLRNNLKGYALDSYKKDITRYSTEDNIAGMILIEKKEKEDEHSVPQKNTNKRTRRPSSKPVTTTKKKSASQAE
jgi:hypothetical protein